MSRIHTLGALAITLLVGFCPPVFARSDGAHAASTVQSAPIQPTKAPIQTVYYYGHHPYYHPYRPYGRYYARPVYPYYRYRPYYRPVYPYYYGAPGIYFGFGW